MVIKFIRNNQDKDKFGLQKKRKKYLFIYKIPLDNVYSTSDCTRMTLSRQFGVTPSGLTLVPSGV